MNTHRIMFACTAAAGGLLAALSFSTAPAGADVWDLVDVGTPPDLLSESGMPPWYQSVLEEVSIGAVDHQSADLHPEFLVQGLLSSTNSFGVTNEDFVVVNGDDFYLPDHSVIDIWNPGGGFENIYADLVGLGTGGANEITDTVVTPFGNFDIPVTFDAAAFGPDPAASADWAALLEPGGFAAALDADWATLVADFGALF